MDEQADLLQMILEEPDDDGPRLIYADWLEERADPRAEFIRVQVSLATMEREDPRRPALVEREAEILAEHARTWLGSLRRVVSGYEFRRGFVEVVTMETTAFLTHADALFHLVPLRHVRLLGAGELIAELAECRFLARLAGLQLNANYIGDFGAQALASSPYIAELRTLHLGHNRLADEGACALAGSPYISQLTALDLSHNLIRNRGTRALAESRSLARLTSLNLASNRIRDAGASALAASSHLRNLSRLDLSSYLTASPGEVERGNEISSEQRQALRKRFGETACQF